MAALGGALPPTLAQLGRGRTLVPRLRGVLDTRLRQVWVWGGCPMGAGGQVWGLGGAIGAGEDYGCWGGDNGGAVGGDMGAWGGICGCWGGKWGVWGAKYGC